MGTLKPYQMKQIALKNDFLLAGVKDMNYGEITLKNETLATEFSTFKYP